MQTEGSQNCFADRGKNASCERQLVMPFLFGESSKTIVSTNEQEKGSKESIVPCSEMNPVFDPAFLSSKRIGLLISYGLIRGITPTSIRKQSGAAIPDFVLSHPVGNV